MSGDVQPRKRKDKKRKKDDGSEHGATHAQPPIIPNITEEQNIHIHKEEGTGGGICAKFVFFLLFSALIVCIGLIITEHRGLTDLDTAESESRFSQIFEGWIDSSPGHEDDNDHLEYSLENHEDEEETHDSHEMDDEHDEEDDEEQQENELSKEESQQDEEEVDEAEEDEDEIRSEEDDDEEVDEDNEDRSDVQDEDDDDNDVDDGDDDNDEEEEEDEEEGEEENVELFEEKEAEDDNGEPSVEDNEEEDEDNISEQAKSDEDHDDEDNDNNDEIDEEDAVEDEESDNKEVAGSEENVDRQDEVADEVEENHENSRMAVKIGVGLALLVVAYVVLVRKWKSAPPVPSDSEDFTTTPDLSRRNTIVVPPTFQQVKQDIEENADEEYSEDSGDVANEDDKTKLKTVKVKYQQLRTTYSRSLTPEDDPNKTNDKEDVVEDEEEEEEEDDEEEDEEEVEDEGEQDDEEAVEEIEDEEEEDDEEDYENEDYDEDDEELLKRLEAKYGKLSDKNTKKEEELDQKFSSWKRINVRPDNEPEESDSDKQSDDAQYEYENVTNKDDWKIKEKIDQAQKAVENNAAYAVKLFEILLEKYPTSPRCYYGKAQALDKLAEQKRSNNLLQQAINTYLKLLDLHDVPDVLFENAAERCINRMRFIGDSSRAVDVHLKLIDRFPNTPKHRNQLAVSYLTINRPNEARFVLKDTLSKYPNDGFALVHYGFILKTADNNLNQSVDYMRRGIATKDPGVIDGRFYFHLGDALARLGKVDEAMKVYEEGVANNLFLSKYQRSLYNVDRLTGKPWWDKNETPYQKLYTQLESNWEIIRNEGLALLGRSGYFQNESENLKDTGDWKQFELFARGQKNIENCKKCPATCRIIESIPEARSCRRGQTKFSVMHPGTHVWPHCGPTNCRLRIHLGLSVPPNTFIRVADEIRSWENGKILIFDDSFEHEVWHNGTELRLVLIVDVWHPELTITEERTLSPI